MKKNANLDHWEHEIIAFEMERSDRIADALLAADTPREAEVYRIADDLKARCEAETLSPSHLCREEIEVITEALVGGSYMDVATDAYHFTRFELEVYRKAFRSLCRRFGLVVFTVNGIPYAHVPETFEAAATAYVPW